MEKSILKATHGSDKTPLTVQNYHSMKKLLILLTAVCYLSSCATLFQGSRKDISIKSMTPGANIYVNGELKGTDGVSLKLLRRSNYTVLVKKDGFESKTVEIAKHTQVGWVIFDILLDIPGLIIDAVTGAWNNLDKDNITVELDKSK